MPEFLGEHAGFIFASYAITFLVVAGLIVWVRLDGRAQLRELDAMKRRGLRRRAQTGD